MRMRCRNLTRDSSGIGIGDEVYVDFAGFVYPRALIDGALGEFPRSEAVMEMRPGRFVRRRKILWFNAGTEVELMAHAPALARSR